MGNNQNGCARIFFSGIFERSTPALDRKLADRRTYPAIDINRSATRREELLLDENTLNRMYILRKLLAPLSPVDSMEFLLEKIKHTESNIEFLDSMNS